MSSAKPATDWRHACKTGYKTATIYLEDGTIGPFVGYTGTEIPWHVV
jgi:hypothetical protein